MPFLRKRIYSGAVLEIGEYYSLRIPKSIRWPEIGKKTIRGKNRNVTPEQQQKLNNRNAVNYLGQMINANFGPNDLFLTTDYEKEPLLPNGEPDEEQAMKDEQKLIRRLRRECKKANIEFNYIGVIEKATEEGRKRIHHHIFISKMSMDSTVACWDLGGLTIRRMDATKDYKGIANYLSKDPTLGIDHKKRWTQSKGLKKPVIRVKKINHPGDYIEPPKGYKEIMDRSYWSDISGLIRYRRYIRIDGTDYASQILKDSIDIDQINSA